MRRSCFILLSAATALLLSSCSVNCHKNITYLTADKASQKDLKLDVFSPKKIEEKKDVFVFLHGGGWRHGKKSMYTFFGKRMAKKGVIGVNISYPLSPDADYDGMAEASAHAIKWIKENISKYGGDPERIFISGHSAGGHLAALITVKQEYFQELNLKDPVKGVILIDAAGLDMYNYLKKQADKGNTQYQSVFTTNPENWKRGSPIYYLHEGVPPMLIFTGEKTYPNIKSSNKRFINELPQHSIKFEHKEIRRKHHIPMIFQFYNGRNPLYNDILKFMAEQK
ncbi:MAG: esterase [Bacteroidetes bacterium]|jgi:acetyl esterase/lipase|nr:esterase [Bacteroidota bacterium]